VIAIIAILAAILFPVFAQAKMAAKKEKVGTESLTVLSNYQMSVSYRNASGEAELAIQQKPELMSTEGVEILGPLPPEINVTTVFSAGVSKDAKESGPSSELLKYLESAEAAVVFERDGFDPPPRSASR